MHVLPTIPFYLTVRMKNIDTNPIEPTLDQTSKDENSDTEINNNEQDVAANKKAKSKRKQVLITIYVMGHILTEFSLPVHFVFFVLF